MRPTGTSRIEVLRILGGSWKQRWTAGIAMCLGSQSRSSKQMTDGVCHGTHWQDGYGMKHMVLEDTCMFEGQRLSVRLREKDKACINQGRSCTKRGGTWLRQVAFSPWRDWRLCKKSVLNWRVLALSGLTVFSTVLWHSQATLLPCWQMLADTPGLLRLQSPESDKLTFFVSCPLCHPQPIIATNTEVFIKKKSVKFGDMWSLYKLALWKRIHPWPMVLNSASVLFANGFWPFRFLFLVCGVASW